MKINKKRNSWWHNTLLKILPKSNRSQAWGMDLVFGFIIFTVGILAFFVYSINQSGEVRENFESLGVDGSFILNNILSDGYPQDWNSSNVVVIGILSNNKINETKLERFYNLTQSNYPITRSLFRTKYDYYFYFDNDNITISSGIIDGIGKPGVNRTNISSNNLIKISRYSIYKNKPVVINLDIWEG